MSILDNFLEIDKDINLNNYTFSYNNILMYPFIRFYFLEWIIEKINSIPYIYNSERKSIFKYIIYLFKSFYYKYSNHSNFDILFFCSDISNILENDSYYNRLTDYFANEYPNNTLLLENSFKYNYKRPRKFKNVYSKDYIFINSILKSKFKICSKKDLSTINSFIFYLQQHYNFCSFNKIIWKNLKNILIKHAKLLPYLFNEYSKLLKKISPKIIFLEDALYGNDKIPIILVSKYLNIPIGEYQHGGISFSHPAYNYSNNLFIQYKKYMPDFFMSWGKYWTENSHIPISIINIGNPYLSENAIESNELNKDEKVLYISSSYTPNQYVDDILYLNKNLCNKGYSVVFRIHPNEILRLNKEYKSIIDANIPIDTLPLYESLKSTKFIVGDISTVLFEAVIFNCIIFVRDNNFNRDNTKNIDFNFISSMQDMIEQITSKNYIKSKNNHFWTINWRKNYHQLIDSYIKYKNE